MHQLNSDFIFARTPPHTDATTDQDDSLAKVVVRNSIHLICYYIRFFVIWMVIPLLGRPTADLTYWVELFGLVIIISLAWDLFMGRVMTISRNVLIRIIRCKTLRRCPDYKKTVSRPPGIWLDRLAEFFASSRTYHLCLRPTIDDMQQEYYEALAAGRTMKTRWIRIAGSWAFWKTWGLATVGNTVVKIVAKIMAG